MIIYKGNSYMTAISMLTREIICCSRLRNSSAECNGYANCFRVVSKEPRGDDRALTWLVHRVRSNWEMGMTFNFLPTERTLMRRRSM